MAAEVFGSIVGANGVEDITLNNAATEATLKALLAATAKTPQAIEAAMNLAKSAGLDPEIAGRAERNIDRLGVGAVDLDGDFGSLQQSTKKVNINFNSIMASTGQLIEGTATFGGILNTLGGVLPAKLGFFVEMLGKAAEFQARSLQTYQLISSSGANFSGNLMEMRLAAAQSYLTLAEFSNVVRNNSSTLAKMGGSVDDGVRAFAVLNKSLISSPAGEKLLALGLTTEDVSNGMLTFINAIGGRSKTELGNTAAITEATSNYLVELDKLTQFSGISRKEQEELQKKAAASGAYQLALSKMTTDQAARAQIGLAAAQTQGAGAVDLFMANIAGLPAAMTADGQKFQGMFGAAAQGITGMANAAKSTTGTIDDVRNAFGIANEGLVRGVNSVGLSGSVMSLKGDQVVNAAQIQANRLQQQGAETAAGTAKIFKDIEANQKKQGDSQAKVAVDVELAMKKLGAEILALMAGPLVVTGEVLKVFAENIGKISVGLIVLGGILAAYKAYALSQAFQGANTMGGKMDALFGEWGRSPTKALWVRVVPGGGSLGGADTPGGGPGTPDEKGKGGKMAGAKILGKGVAGIAGGFALDYAAEKAQASGNTTTAGVLDTASSGLTGFGMGSMALGALALLGAPLTGGLSLGLLGLATAGGLGAGLYSNKDALFGSTPKLTAETAPTEPKTSEDAPKMVAGYQQRAAENSDKMLMILRELRDISMEHRDIDKGTAPYLVKTSTGGLEWHTRKE